MCWSNFQSVDLTFICWTNIWSIGPTFDMFICSLSCWFKFWSVYLTVDLLISLLFLWTVNLFLFCGSSFDLLIYFSSVDFYSLSIDLAFDMLIKLVLCWSFDMLVPFGRPDSPWWFLVDADGFVLTLLYVYIRFWCCCWFHVRHVSVSWLKLSPQGLCFLGCQHYVK